MENGGPAPESVTDKIFSNTTTITEYLIAEDLPDVRVDADLLVFVVCFAPRVLKYMFHSFILAHIAG